MTSLQAPADPKGGDACWLHCQHAGLVGRLHLAQAADLEAVMHLKGVADTTRGRQACHAGQQHCASNLQNKQQECPL